MKRCDYFGCVDYILEFSSDGFHFCDEHTEALLDIIQYDKLNKLDLINSIGFCLSSLNNKMQKNSHIVI